jgi:hypothetical protein
MACCRSILVLSLVALWVATPALACLPNPQMTPAEMECCKKMAGDCHMGVGQHPCCKTISTAPQPVASIQPVQHIHPDFTVVGVTPLVQILFVPVTESEQVALGLPPPAPPGLHSILRI